MRQVSKPEALTPPAASSQAVSLHASLQEGSINGEPANVPRTCTWF